MSNKTDLDGYDVKTRRMKEGARPNFFATF